MLFQKVKEFSPIFLRYSMAALFLWFGLNQLFNSGAWVAWVPDRLFGLAVNPVTVIMVNGSFETLFGLFLAVGLFTRFSAVVLALHLFGIAFTIGYNDISVRDYAIALATLAVAMHGSDALSYDKKLKKSWWGHTSLAKFLSFYEKDF